MTESLDGKLPEGRIKKFNLCTKDYGCESISRYIKFPFGSQNMDVLDILEISL